MLNKIWFWLLFLGIAYGSGKALVRTVVGGPTKVDSAVTEPMEEGMGDAKSAASAELPLVQMGRELNDAALGAARTSVELCILLIGVMTLWLGLLQVAKDAGLVDALARFLQPLMRWLFPDIPDGHPAQGAILMNFSANMLGLDNAATPFGLKAMRELQTLNRAKDSATNAMCMFLAINTSNITLIPISIIGLRVAAKSQSPAAPLAAMLVATTISTIVAILAARGLQGLRPLVEAASDPPSAEPPSPKEEGV